MFFQNEFNLTVFVQFLFADLFQMSNKWLCKGIASMIQSDKIYDSVSFARVFGKNIGIVGCLFGRFYTMEALVLVTEWWLCEFHLDRGGGSALAPHICQ